MACLAAGIAHEPYDAGPSRFPGCAWVYIGGMVFSAAGTAHKPCAAGIAHEPCPSGIAHDPCPAGKAHEPRPGMPETLNPNLARSPPAYGTVLWGD